MKIARQAMAFVAALAFAASAFAQGAAPKRATVTSSAPIFAAIGAIRPLRVAAAGTVLEVVSDRGAWLNVRFQDPQAGPQLGYIETKLVRINDPSLEPIDLSVPQAATAAPARAESAPLAKSLSTAPTAAATPALTASLEERAPIRAPGRAYQRGRAAVIYITPTEDRFETYLTAAMTKKKVPVSVTTNPELATLTLTAAQIEEEIVSTGKRVVNCLFAYCAGNENKASTSATLTDSEGTVVWSYAVNKGRGAKNRQSMAEAIAKHLNDEFLDR